MPSPQMDRQPAVINREQTVPTSSMTTTAAISTALTTVFFISEQNSWHKKQQAEMWLSSIILFINWITPFQAFSDRLKAKITIGTQLTPQHRLRQASGTDRCSSPFPSLVFTDIWYRREPDIDSRTITFQVVSGHPDGNILLIINRRIHKNKTKHCRIQPNQAGSTDNMEG